MHPAKSVIFFTVLSGLGYGLLSLIYIMWAWHGTPDNNYLYSGFIALSFVSIGLLSSLFHLGRPERAWRALSQWRSSWLSREGVLSILSYIPALLSVITQDVIIAYVGIVLNIASVYSTAMIYASLKPIPAWHHYLVPMNYLIMSFVSGLFLYVTLQYIIPLGAPHTYFDNILYMASFIMLFAKVAYWIHINTTIQRSSTGTATGLGKLGTVRLIDPPHDGSNYLMKEMIFEVARKKLNLIRISTVILWVLAGLLLLTFDASSIVIAISFLLILLGAFLERWLFFAEAKHVISLFY